MFTNCTFEVKDNLCTYTIYDTEFVDTFSIPVAYQKDEKEFSEEKEIKFVFNFLNSFIKLYESKKMNVVQNLVQFYQLILFPSGLPEDQKAFDLVISKQSEEFQAEVKFLLNKNRVLN